MRKPTILTPSRSLAAKITLWVIATMLAIFVIITLFIYKTTAQGIYYEANARYMGLLSSNNEHVNATLKAVEVAVSNTLPMVEENIHTPQHLYSVVRQIVAQNPDIVGSAIAFEPGYFKEMGLQFSPYAYRQDTVIRTKQLGTADYEYHHMDWYQTPKLLGKPYWSEPYFDLDGGNTMMTTYSYPLYDGEGKLYAIFTADIALEWLSRMMQETDSINNSELGTGQGHSYSFIIGRSGTYIAHPNPERVVNETLFDYCMETADTIDDHISREMLSGKQGNAIFNHDKRLRIYYAPIRRTGWSMAIIVPDHEIVYMAQRVGATIIGLMLLGLCIVFLVCYFAIKRTTEPLTRFAASADEISRGNFNTHLPAVTTHDEMRLLHDSFQTMLRSLNHHINETVRMTEQKSRIESELHIARAIQMAMLPTVFPPFPDCDEVAIYGQLTSAKEVGGDLYDFYIRDEKLFFCIGDVSGKGIPASLVMAVTRSLFRTISSHESQPERIVSLLSNVIAEDNEMCMFVTLFVGVLELTTGNMTYCNAGHDAPLLISRDGRSISLMPVDNNIPAGVMEGWKYSRQDIQIWGGTTIFLYTDGLTEAEDIQHGQFGEERMLQAAAQISADGKMTPHSLLDGISDAVRAFVGDAEQSDDLTMMAVTYMRGVSEKSEERLRRTLTLPNNIEAIPQLGEFIDDVAAAVGLDASLAMTLNLALEEAVVNVMNYAYPEGTQGTVSIKTIVDSQEITFIISDSGMPFDPTTKEDVDTSLPLDERPIGGLGIHMVRQIMDSISYAYIGGKNMLTLRKKICQTA